MNDLSLAIFELTLILFLVNFLWARKLILNGGAIRPTDFFKKK